MPVQCENCGQKSSDSPQPRPAELFLNNQTGKSAGELNICPKCVSYFDARSSAAEDVLSSVDKHRLVIAGPGCGKTYLFKEAVKRMPSGSKVLLLTFINNLKDDLEKDLRQLALDDIDITVRTLHSFEAAEFHRLHPNWEYFPGLPYLVEDDAKNLGYGHSASDFNNSFANLIDTEARCFYMKRANCYQAAGYDDAGFRVLNHYKNDPDKRPSYDLVVVDEYQDFNQLEAEFLQNLGDGNNMLVAGDDDQSIYGFKHASPTFLQELHSGEDSDFVPFGLPHSGRCPDVVVEAVNAAIRGATDAGLLKGRINKKYASYFPDKFEDDKKHPLIHRVKCTTDKVSWQYVATKIKADSDHVDPTKISDSHEPYYLIVGSGLRANHLSSISNMLKEQLDAEKFEIEGYESSDERGGVAKEEGYRLIRENPDSNLGWRIVLFNDPSDCDLLSILEQSETGVSLRDLLPKDLVERHEEAANEVPQTVVDPSTNLESVEGPKIKVKVTTFLKAKGLSAAHVFVIGLIDGVIPIDPSNITDDEFRQFLVSLTRTRKSLHLITHKVFVRGQGRLDQSSTLLSLIPPSLMVESDFKANDFK